MTATATAVEYVQDESTNNLHLRGADRDDRPESPETALCNKRYRVWVPSDQASAAADYASWNSCQRCDAKAAATSKRSYRRDVAGVWQVYIGGARGVLVGFVHETGDGWVAQDVDRVDVGSAATRAQAAALLS